MHENISYTIIDYLGKEKVGIAFDNMVVNRFNMKLIPSMYEALKR